MNGDWDFLKWLWGLLVPYNIYLHRKIDRLTEDHINRLEFNGTIQSLREAVNNISVEITRRIDHLIALLIERSK